MPRDDWVDFKAVKTAVTIEQVLERYGVIPNLTRKGDRLTGVCPIHKGTKKGQFSVTLSVNAFKCFSGDCGASGNQVDLVAYLEGFYPHGKTAEGFRKAAKLMQGWAGIEPKRGKEAAPAADAPAVPETPAAEVTAPAKAEPPAENKPLSFQLRLDTEHVYPKDRGLTPATIATFGLGFSGKGSMTGRIAIPIHNAQGELVAYAGRWVGDADPPEGEGKYKLPPGFHKSLVVYNLHRITGSPKSLILVEGCWSVFWLHQNGFLNVVSVLGSTISPEQVKLLAARTKGVQVFFDGDTAGREGGRKVAIELLSAGLWVKVVDCPEGLQPDRLPAHELKRLLG
jgi:DNA primase